VFVIKSALKSSSKAFQKLNKTINNQLIQHMCKY